MRDHGPGGRRRADVLRDRREDILQAWERAVRSSHAGPRLDGPSLRDHVSELLDRVASILSPSAPVDGDPREHGRTRAAQGVGIVPVLAELGVLRRVVLDFWAADGGLDREAVHALDRVVDEAAMEAARRISDTFDGFFRGVDAISRASLESRDVDDLLRRMLEAIVRTSPAVDAAAILLREDDRLRVRAGVGLSGVAVADVSLRVGQGFAGKIAAEARPLALEDAADALAAGDALLGQGVRVLYGVPLVHEGKVMGVAEMGSSGATGLSPEDRRLLESMASRAAAALARQLGRDEDRREALLREHVLAVVSHDLRNPLSTVLMGASRLEAKAPRGRDGDDLLRLAQGMRRAARRMERLIGDLMDVAAIQSGRLSVSREPREPEDLVREAVESASALAHERQLALEARPEAGLPRVLADRDRVLQVISNLVSNALDVTPPGGRVTVRAEAAPGAVRFEVSDTGPGMAAEDVAHVFEPYRRGAAPGYKGTGLGLAIANGIVAAHGGQIGVDTAPGKGATFWFTLPVAVAR